MKQLNRIKEKINKITADIERMERLGVSPIDLDILLEDIRTAYKDVIELESFAKDDRHKQEQKTTEEIQDEIPKQTIIDEEVINTAEDKKEPELSLDYDEKDSDGEKIETNSQTTEINTHAGTGSITENGNETEKPKEKQSKLFDNNNHNEVKKVIGEQLGNNKKSLNEKYARFHDAVSDRVKLSPLSEIKSGIGLGDRFLYIRELFGGSNDLFEETIDKLNEMDSMEKALEYLDENFCWNAESPTVITFLNVVKRKYLK